MIKCKPYIDSSIHSPISKQRPFSPQCLLQAPVMVPVPEMEKPRVTEIMVRMDCNGCVQKIKRALHGITDYPLTRCLYMVGIYDLYIDFPQQKITIIGWAEPEKIVKAIKKTRKSAIICSHTEQPDQQAQETGVPEGGTAEGGAPPPPESSQSTNPQAEAVPPEAPRESPPPPENPPPEEKPAPEPGSETSQTFQPNQPEEIHVIHHHPPDYGYRYAYGYSHQQGVGGQWNTNTTSPGFRGESPQPVHASHSYNTYKPSPYVTEYAYHHSPRGYVHYSRPDQYSQVYSSGNNDGGYGNGNITSIFSEENPNACSIV